MTRKERRYVIEGTAIAAALALLILFVLPSLINAHDTMAFFAAVFIAAGGFGWLAYFLYRLNGDFR